MAKCVIFEDINCRGIKTLNGTDVEMNFSANTELSFGGLLDRVCKNGIFLAICGSIIFIPRYAARIKR